MSSSITSFSHEKILLPSGLALEANLSVPLRYRSAEASQQVEENKLAVCLHPWSWLGGQMDDPVLQHVERVLLQRGYHVLRYNSRGVGKSSGWPSLNGLQEGQDLQEVVRWALDHMTSVTSVIITGYSHGALVASLFPPLPEPMKVSHILVSYPLGPRTWLTAFKSATYTSTLNDLLQNPRSDVLIIYGDCDQFTGEQNYDAWSEDLKAQVSGDGKGKLEIAKIDGASHFWIDREDCKNRLLQKIVEWDS